MKDAEVKKNYKGHCAAATKVMEKPRNKYHPEWNLEMAKCHMRNRRYAEAVRSIDRTLGDSFGMTAASKVARLLLAYEIKAQSRTKLYDDLGLHTFDFFQFLKTVSDDGIVSDVVSGERCGSQKRDFGS